MFEGLKKEWRSFRRGKPGQRFQDRFERNQKARSGKSRLTADLRPFFVIVLFAAGVVLCFIPDPALPLILIGAGLLADVSRPVARAMDWVEMRVRKILGIARDWWEHASQKAKQAVITGGVLLATGAVYGGFRFLASRM